MDALPGGPAGIEPVEQALHEIEQAPSIGALLGAEAQAAPTGRPGVCRLSTRKTTCFLATAVTTAGYSAPSPLNRQTASPGRARSTVARW